MSIPIRWTGPFYFSIFISDMVPISYGHYRAMAFPCTSLVGEIAPFSQVPPRIATCHSWIRFPRHIIHYLHTGPTSSKGTMLLTISGHHRLLATWRPPLHPSPDFQVFWQGAKSPSENLETFWWRIGASPEFLVFRRPSNLMMSPPCHVDSHSKFMFPLLSS